MNPEQAKQEFQKVVDYLTGELTQIRTGRANPALVTDVSVDAYGTPTPVKQLAQVSVPEATVIAVAPWDKGLVKPIEDALTQAEVGQVSNNGVTIQVTVPAMTEERRLEFSKLAGEKLESAKISVRNVRQEAIKKAERDDPAEDEMNRFKKLVDQNASEAQQKLEEMTKAKQQEIETV
ncbi:ribosome recycling factor [Patescibacteria group bacterium]|nr:ribosome recycling factor [Patescibacteria group bacterium]